MRSAKTVGCLMLLCCVAGAQQYVISTVAGGAVAPTPQPATSASVYPMYVAADSSGNFYFAGNTVPCVFKVDKNGVLSVIAGGVHPGFSGDGGPAVNAQLSSVSGLATDAAGNLYIADFYRVRKISASGVITTVAGIGYTTPTFSGDGGPAVNAATIPQGLALDGAGNLYIADNINNRIRKVTANGIIQTIAGNGKQGYSGDGGPATQAALSFNPMQALAVDHGGNVYFVSLASQGIPLTTRIRKVSPGGTITSVAGNGGDGTGGDGGPAIDAQFTFANCVAVDGAGNLYVGDSSRVRKISTNGTITTVAGATQPGFLGDGGPATSAELTSVNGLAADASGNLLIVDENNYRVRKVSGDGTITTVAGDGFQSYSGDGGPAVAAQLDLPRAVAVDNTGNLYIADFANCRIRRVSANGTITTAAGNGICGIAIEGQLATSAHIGRSAGVAVDSSGNLFFSDSNNACIWEVGSDGLVHRVAGGAVRGYGGDGGPALQADFVVPWGIAFDNSGNLYVVDEANNRVRKIASNGITSTVAGNGTQGFSGDGGPASNAALNDPQSVAIDAAGSIYIADEGNNRIRKVSPGGTISTIAGNGAFGQGSASGPAAQAQLTVEGVAVDGNGSLYVAGEYVYRISAAGVISTIAGGGSDYSGDGGPALGAGVNAIALTVDASGKINVVDIYNDVRLLSPVIPLTVANAASNIAGSIAPGEIVTLYGSGLGPSQLVQAVAASDGSFGTQLANTVVTIGGIAAPLLYVWNTQTAAIVPYEVSGSTVSVSVTYQGKSAASTSVAVAAAAPAIFTSDSSGKGQAAAINPDNSINSANTPAHVGDVIVLFATGEGQTSPSGRDGQPATAPLPYPVLPVTVTIGGQTAQVQYAGGAPGEVAGVMQINVQIPSGIQTGDAVPVVVQIGNFSSQTRVGDFSSSTGVTLAIR